MPKGYRAYLPEQDLLLPPSLRDWLPENHLVYFVSDLVDELDHFKIHAHYGDEGRGQPPYDPQLMTKLLVYSYCVGVFSSRRIQKRLQEDIAFRVLAAGNEPDFRTISDFRKLHLAALKEMFQQVLRLALESGAMKLGRVALDGTKIKANDSTGPDANQREFLEALGREVRQRAFDGQHAVMPIRMAESSGHGTGKSALGAWIANWILSTRPWSIGTVTAGTACWPSKA